MRPGIDVADILAADNHTPRADRRRARPLRDGAAAGEVRLIGGTPGGGFALVRFELDESTGGQFVQLLVEVEFQFVDVLVIKVLPIVKTKISRN
ncbi:MAG: hypothetical protein U1F70_17255 [Candidatus Competibacteraceae bacterium]